MPRFGTPEVLFMLSVGVLIVVVAFPMLLIFFNAFMFTGWLLGPAPKSTDGMFVMSLVAQLIGITLAYATDRFREAR